jgi:XamI restriction endonuclease
MIEPPRWSEQQLEDGRKTAIEMFRRERLEEPLEDYLEAFDDYQGRIEDLLETTVDLTDLDESALELLTDAKLQEAFRYLAGPPISKDDLKTVAEAPSLNAGRLRNDLDTVRRIVEVVLQGLDRRRFPWVRENREPTASERTAAIIASAALMAASRVGTKRRSSGKRIQEGRVEGAFVGAGFVRVPSREVPTVAQAPEPGHFCGESPLGTRKADFIVRLWDFRMMPIECKVSNSAVNSVKRLNNDAAAKAVAWRHDFGATQIVPVAVLSGVYKIHNLLEAQDRGLTLIWAHDLNPLIEWVERMRLES